ncbi:hypothetical protein [Rhizobium sp. WYJ-E13]|uniref:hypothetical protein n=1 Tax=Rhizobium sp. WYJ-E13 TaxID=2849093 RepID=UPI001C1ED847|nr:hypothetical protein [Rhizobium sp. WYJ-E13]QWW72461.1 hypothetical protein KQ933_31550 [Rhizobium sp. WYJ-E13]
MNIFKACRQILRKSASIDEENRDRFAHLETLRRYLDSEIPGPDGNAALDQATGKLTRHSALAHANDENWGYDRESFRMYEGTGRSTLLSRSRRGL